MQWTLELQSEMRGSLEKKKPLPGNNLLLLLLLGGMFKTAGQYGQTLFWFYLRSGIRYRSKDLAIQEASMNETAFVYISSILTRALIQSRISYQCMKSLCGNKMVIRSSHFHHGASYTDKMTCFFYWSGASYVFQFECIWVFVKFCKILLHNL